MNKLENLKNYANLFIDALSPYLKKGFQISARVHPSSGDGAIIEFEIHEGKRSDITIVPTVPRINDTLAHIDQRMIGGNIQGVTFRGTNLYMDGNRIVVIKGEEEDSCWDKKAATEDVARVVSPKEGAK